jgi:hypothetical protein
VLTGLTVLTADRMDTVDVIDEVVQTAQPATLSTTSAVNKVNDVRRQSSQHRQSSQYCPKPYAPRRRRLEPPAHKKAQRIYNKRSSLVQNKHTQNFLDTISHAKLAIKFFYCTGFGPIDLC